MRTNYKHFTAIILLLAVAMATAAQTLSERYNDSRPVVIVYNYKKPSGFYLEIATKIAEKMGVAYRIETKLGDAGWQAFEDGKVDLILTNNQKYNIGKYVTSKCIVDFKRVSADSITETHLTGKDRQLIEQIDDYYTRMKQDGEIEEILLRWTNPEYAKAETPRTVIHIADALLILSGVLIVLGLLLLWHIRNTRKHTAEIKEMIAQVKLMSQSNYAAQNNKAAHDLKQKYDAIITNPFVAIAFYDKDGRLIEMNETMRRARHDDTTSLRQPLYNADGEIIHYIVAVNKRKLTTT